MLLIYSRLSFEDGGDSWETVRLGDRWVRYRLDACDHVYTDDRFTILADTIIDKSRADKFHDTAKGLAQSLTRKESLSSDTLGACFLIALDKRAGMLRMFRDPTGIKTGYYCRTDDSLHISTCVHEVARSAGVSEFSEEAIYQVLYLQYTFDGDTYYRSVREVKMGNQLRVTPDLGVELEHEHGIMLADRDNDLSFEANRDRLRQETVAAHRKYLSSENVVLLSGGLDSGVMLGSLHEAAAGPKIRAVTFRVKGTEEDETEYALSVGRRLGVEPHIVEVDPNELGAFEQLVQNVLQMNNPYYGMAVFGRIPEPKATETYFAGQDTRLHTPDVNPVDKFAFRLFFARRRRRWNLIMRVASGLARVLGVIGSSSSRTRWRRAFRLICDAFHIERYVRKYFFGYDQQPLRAMGVPLHHWDRIGERLQIDFGRIKGPRHLYNEIVRIKYREQYTDQIRYIQSLARVCGTYIAMPFHDARLVEYCSSIPFDQVTRFGMGRGRFSDRKRIINKLLLREAFRDKLSDKVYYRKKAVSSSLHLLFNGALGGFVTEIIAGDLNDDHSFLQEYRLQLVVERFMHGERWRAEDEKYLYRVYYLAMFCVYNKHVLAPSRQRAHVVESTSSDS